MGQNCAGLDRESDVGRIGCWCQNLPTTFEELQIIKKSSSQTRSQPVLAIWLISVLDIFAQL